MYGTILIFIKFNNFDTGHLNGPGVYFIHSAAPPGAYLSPHVYMSPALIWITWFHGGGKNKENPTIIYYITKDHIAMHTIFF